MSNYDEQSIPAGSCQRSSMSKETLIMLNYEDSELFVTVAYPVYSASFTGFSKFI